MTEATICQILFYQMNIISKSVEDTKVSKAIISIRLNYVQNDAQGGQII